MLDIAGELLGEADFASACVLSLSSVISEWGVESSPAGDDSIHLAGLLYGHAGKMPNASAGALAQIAWHHKWKGPAAGKLPALEWVIDRLAVNPSPPDRDRNIWHELIASAVVSTSKGCIDGDFATIDDLPMDLIERMSARHGPADPLPADPRSPVRKLLPNDVAPDDIDMVSLLVRHCGSDIGLRKALSLQYSRQMDARTRAAKSTGPASARM